MNVDLSNQDIALIIRRFNETPQTDIDEQLLVQKLSRYLPKQDNNIMRKYQDSFKTEIRLPPQPGVVEVVGGVPIPDAGR